MRRVIGDAVISGAALLLLLVILTTLDDRVQDQVTAWVYATPNSSAFAGVGRDIREVVTVVVDVARDQSVSHAPLMIFTIAATVLVLFMIRT